MKWKILGIIFVLALGLVVSGCTQQETTTSPVEKTEITIYTGGTGGVYFPLGSKYAELLTKYGTVVSAEAVTSGASVANAKAIENGNAQAVIIQNDVAYYAYNGLYMFEDGSIKKLKGVASLYPETVQIVVRADSDIKTFQDLKGKKVSIGAVGSGCAVGAEQVFKAAGVWDSIDKVYMTMSESSQALRLGQIDALVYVSGAPAAAVTQIATQTPVRLIPVSEEILNKLKDEGYIFYVKQVVPKGTYNGLTEDVPTIAVKAMLAVSEDLPDDVVYEMTKILYEHLDELRTVHQKAQAITLDTALDGMSIPLHPGAIKYYEEKGLTIPSELKG